MSERGKGEQPGRASLASAFPDDARPLVFEGFDGINTKPLRPGVQDQEMPWCDGFIPLGPNNLRTLYGVGHAVYAASEGTIVWYGFGNIGETPFGYVLLSTGRIDQFNILTGDVTTVAVAGTVDSPTPIFGFSQWGNKYILFSADQENGYWIWDGTSLYSAGTIGPTVTLDSVGENYTSQPTITLTTTGTGTGTTFSADLNAQEIETINVTNPGQFFAIDDFNLLTISGGGSDNTATATATIDSTTGGIDSVAVLNGGTLYELPRIQVTGGGGGTGAALAATVTAGVISAVAVINPGTGYTSEPTLTVADAHGLNAELRANIFTGVIASVSVTSPGSGYLEPPEVFVVGDGEGATFQAQIDTTGAVIEVQVVNGGKNYTKALIGFRAGNKAAYGSVSMMPFGVKGTSIETYSSRVWIADGPKVLFTAPSDPGDFGAPTGGGAFRSNDSFLKTAYHRLVQSNGFLYLLGDSSMNYVSGVSTTGTPATTSFNNLNVDPQIGTPWPQSMQVFSRNIVFANSFGVHVSYGGAVQKISQPLDGIYNTVLTQQSGGSFGNFYPSSAVASIFGIQVYMLLLPIIDPFTGVQVNKLLMWNGQKWWVSSQDVDLTYIATQEINSILTAYGTDGSSIYPLFQKPSANLTKVVQSKLWSNPTYLINKTANYIAGIANFYNFAGDLTITVDTERTGTNVSAVTAGLAATWKTQGGSAVTWTNAAAETVSWLVPGLGIIGPQEVATNGVLLGLTISTTAKDVALISMMILGTDYWPLV